MMALEDLFEGCFEIDPAIESEQAITALLAVPSCKGVILFADAENRPVQLLIAGNIRRTARARLYTKQPDTPSKRPEIASIVRRIYYLCCYNDFATALSHYSIAKELWPGNYSDQLTLPKLSLVKIDPSAKWPFFNIVQSIQRNEDEIIFGPFQSRKSAGEFVMAIENAFMLCHRPELVDNRQKAASCPYLQMEKCPAPCVGKIGMDQYREQINKAVSAASGNTEKAIAELNGQMQDFCGELKFELADQVKARIEELQVLCKSSYKWTGRLNDLRIVHIDISEKVKLAGKRKKTQLYSAFIIRENCITQLDAFEFEKIPDFIDSLKNELTSPRTCEDSINRKTRYEQIALLCSFLYRSKPAGLWINCSRDSSENLLNAETLGSMMTKCFDLEIHD